MHNEATLRNAVAEVFAASTRMTGLTGKAAPVVEWGDKGMNDRPIVTWYQPSAAIRKGTKDAFRLDVSLDVWVDADSTNQALAEQIADEVEAVFTTPNLKSTSRTVPVDAAPYLRMRWPMPELDEGRHRLHLEYEVWYTRS